MFICDPATGQLYSQPNWSKTGDGMNKLYSMTGYATEKLEIENGELTCEIRSLNSRFLEIFLKLPQTLKSMEEPIKNLIRQKVGRAKVNCSLTVILPAVLQNGLQVNEAAVKLYAGLLEQIRKSANIQTPLQMSDLMLFKDLFTMEQTEEVDEALLQAVLGLVNSTLDQFNQSRAEEADHLRKDLIQRLGALKQLALEVENLAPENARAEFQKQFERLSKMVDDNVLDRNRLELEVAIISDRVDISEEVVRLKSHIELFHQNLESGSPIGKKLNFILQEMHREANTMSSKNTMIEISHRVVTIKEEIERMREQVQNIE